MGLNTTEVTNALAGAPNSRERRRMVIELAARYGCSAQTIYNTASRGGFTSGRRKRADAGTRELPVTDEQIAQVAALIHQSHTEKGRIPMPAHEAIRLSELSGIIPAGVVTENYLNRWMRERSLDKKAQLARTPHTPLMSLHPNHVHMIDASQCAQWYIAPKGGIRHQRRDFEVYKNKEGKPNKITRLILVDHYSGAFFVGYAASENAYDWIEFLYRAWADKSFMRPALEPFLGDLNFSDVFPFRGLPKMVYADKGSPIRAGFTTRILDSLGIEFGSHMPKNSRAKGANETMQRHWERWFESGLKIKPAESLEELNARAFQCCVHINATRKFTRHGQTRFAMWCAEADSHLIDVPDYEFYKAFALSQPELRKVAMDGTILYKPRFGYLPHETSGVYRVPDVNLYGTQVEVSFCLYNYPAIRIVSRRTGQVFEEQPLHRNGAGFLPEISATLGVNFRSQAETTAQQAIKPLKEAAVIVEASAVDHSLTQADTWTTPAAAQFLITPETEIKTFSRIEAKRRALQQIGAGRADELHPAQQSLLACIGDTIAAADLDTLVAELLAVNTMPQIITLGGDAS